MNNDNNITNVKTTVVLKKPFTYTYYGVTTTIPKDTTFNTRDFVNDGIRIVLGHGDAEVIPHDYLGKYTKTYTVTKETFDDNGYLTVVRKTVKEDVTKDWVTYWKREADKKAAAATRIDRINTKNRIAALRKTIKYVKTGAAEAELNRLLNHLANFA